MSFEQRPTEAAIQLFSLSLDFARMAGDDPRGVEFVLKDLAMSQREMAAGLKHLATGLRATYILLEEVNRKLK